MSAVLTPPPNTVNYQGQLYSVPSILRAPAPAHEGDRFVPFAVDWNADTTAGAGGRGILIDLTRGGVQPISQIAALWVDNSGCNADVQFLFLSTQTRVTVPAQASEMVPVSTNDVRFVMVAPNSGAGDLTFGQIFNFVPPPVALAETEFATSNQIAAVDLTIGGVTNYQIVPAGQNGVVRGLDLNFVGVGGAATSTVIWNLQDGNTVQIADGRFLMRTGVNYDFTKLFNLDFTVPFHNGLVLAVNVSGAAAGAGSTMFGNVYRD